MQYIVSRQVWKIKASRYFDFQSLESKSIPLDQKYEYTYIFIHTRLPRSMRLWMAWNIEMALYNI